MEKYYLRILFGSSFSETTVIADDVDYEDNYIWFYRNNELVASYPPNCTCITKIESIENDEHTVH
jgi:hypothetical protein